MLPVHDMLRIYNQSMRRLRTDMEHFIDRLGLTGESDVLLGNLGGSLAGFAVLDEDAILMLCVKPDARGKGLGDRLLKEAEDFLRERGKTRAVLGHSSKRYLCQGVPCLLDNSAMRFFQNRGYAASWTSADLLAVLPAYIWEDLWIPPLPDGIHLRVCDICDRDAILYAVGLVEKNWMPFYEDASCPVCVAEERGNIVGFVRLEGKIPFARNFAADVGGIGCLGVIPAARGRGIGRRLAAFATNEIKRMGFGVCYAGYTYLEDWYLPIGYNTVDRFWMGEKAL